MTARPPKLNWLGPRVSASRSTRRPRPGSQASAPIPLPKPTNARRSTVAGDASGGTLSAEGTLSARAAWETPTTPRQRRAPARGLVVTWFASIWLAIVTSSCSLDASASHRQGPGDLSRGGAEGDEPSSKLSGIHQTRSRLSKTFIRFSGRRDLESAHMEETAFNPKRRLCPDGSCVGVLGADGRCSVCRRSAGAGGGSGAEAFAEAPDEARADDRDDASGDGAPATEMADGVSTGFDPTRRLCDDGSCVGVVGESGICGTCGQKAQ